MKMKNKIIIKMIRGFSILSISLAVVVAGCRRAGSAEGEIEKWENLGWKYNEVVGDLKSNGLYLSHEIVHNPGSITAFSTTNKGQLETKEYKPITGEIMIVHMGREGKGCYSLVFIK
jgi:hypothetical protein